jgi:ubiquinone/menaquinone biosynthesis C-methylase UbiE
MDKRAFYRNPKVARRYEEVRFGSPAGRLTQELELSALRRAFRPDAKVVELACGTGRLLRALLAEGRDVWGMDQSPEMLAAGGEGLRGRSSVGDAFDPPLPEASFDGAYCLRFTNHFADLSGFFRSCARILRPGGRLVFDSMRWSLLAWDCAALGGRNHCPGDARVAQWLAQAGFAVESVEPLFPVGPYLIGRLPLALARILLRSRDLLPGRLQAVALWHARKL